MEILESCMSNDYLALFEIFTITLSLSIADSTEKLRFMKGEIDLFPNFRMLKCFLKNFCWKGQTFMSKIDTVLETKKALLT